MAETPSFEQEIYETRVHAALQYLALTFFYYDYLLTLGDEIAYIWRKRTTPSAYWFLANRYLGVVGNVAVVVMTGVTTVYNGCDRVGVNERWLLVRQILLIVNQVLSCTLLTLRTYALYSRSKVILWGLVGTMAFLVAISAWSLTGRADEVVAIGCHTAISEARKLKLSVPWICLAGYDTLIFGLTMWQTYRGRYAGMSIRSVPLVALIAQHGAFYYGIMALATVANVLTLVLSGPFLRGSLSSFASCISITMVSRLMLDLHARADTGIHATPNYRHGLPRLFAASHHRPQGQDGFDSRSGVDSRTGTRMEFTTGWNAEFTEGWEMGTRDGGGGDWDGVSNGGGGREGSREEERGRWEESFDGRREGRARGEGERGVE